MSDKLLNAGDVGTIVPAKATVAEVNALYGAADRAAAKDAVEILITGAGSGDLPLILNHVGIDNLTVSSFSLGAEVVFREGCSVAFMDEDARNNFQAAAGIRLYAGTFLVAPATGNTITVGTDKGDAVYKIAPAGNLAALTITFPGAIDCRNGQIITFFVTKNITTLTVNAGSGNALGGPSLTALVENSTYAFFYSEADSTWNYLA